MHYAFQFCCVIYFYIWLWYTLQQTNGLVFYVLASKVSVYIDVLHWHYYFKPFCSENLSHYFVEGENNDELICETTEVEILPSIDFCKFTCQ